MATIALDSRGQTSFSVGTIAVQGDLILAPMAGFSDKPYRLICREYGSAMSYSEFVSVFSILHGNARGLQLLDFDPSERPVVFQIFGSDPVRLEEAARKLESRGPDIIDINMGCSTAKICNRGAGAALLNDPAKIGHIVRRLTRALSIPITAKIRLGWDLESLNYVQVARILEDNGAALIAVHGRSKSQTYADPANWDAIAEIKRSVRIPVIGNGDVRCRQDIERLKQHTGCDGVMIGRAAIGNPWLFRRQDQVTLTERVNMIDRHKRSMLDFYGEERGLINFRKHVVKYLRGLPNSNTLKRQLLACSQVDEFDARLEAYAASAVESEHSPGPRQAPRGEPALSSGQNGSQ